jgi:hypothetical protein
MPTVISGTTGVSQVQNSSITNEDLTSGIDASKLTIGTLPISRIADGAVGNAKLADGSVVQVVHSATSTITLVNSTNATHYFDYLAALPSSQGIEILTQAITPSSSTNKVLVKLVCPYSGSGSLTPIVAVFRNAGTSPVAAAWESISGALVGNLILEFLDSPATISSTTYRVRIGRGGSAGWYNNAGIDGATIMGGMLKTTLTLTEIKSS